MSTFSQIVDEMVAEHIRPDLRASIVAYTNQTIRELHGRRNDGSPILFTGNRVEELWAVDATPALWPIPSVARFQRLETAFMVERGQYAFERSLSRVYEESQNADTRYYWYRSGAFVAFGDRMGSLSTDDSIKLSYFMFPPLLKYYAEGSRPATFDVETEEFTYHADYDVSDETRAEAEAKSTNWILLRWGEAVVKQGIRSKIYSRMGEIERGRLAYSHFESMREQMLTSETWQQNPL